MPTVRFSDRASLSSTAYLGIWFRRTERLGAGHASLRSRSRPEGRRCTHWSDGVESHAYGRAWQRSRHLRLHPDHRLHLNAQSSIPFDSGNLLQETGRAFALPFEPPKMAHERGSRRANEGICGFRRKNIAAGFQTRPRPFVTRLKQYIDRHSRRRARTSAPLLLSGSPRCPFPPRRTHPVPPGARCAPRGAP